MEPNEAGGGRRRLVDQDTGRDLGRPVARTAIADADAEVVVDPVSDEATELSLNLRWQRGQPGRILYLAVREGLGQDPETTAFASARDSETTGSSAT